jgi:predicted Zn-dependent protease
MDRDAAPTTANPFTAITRRRTLSLMGCGCASAALTACAYNEDLGRSQLVFVSSGQMAQLASSAWSDLKKQEKVSTDPKYTARVNRVAPKIIAAAGGNPSEWEVQVFASKDLNAFALPGGKIGFYTGILDIMDNDAQIAAVMGHEVAHVNYNHSGERYSQQVGSSVAISVAQAAIGTGSQTGQLAMAALGVGAQVGVLLPFSRKHELEADKFGLRYMHRAGYDPNEAIRFWQKMSSQKSGSPPEFLSTHPADATRIAQLEREIALLN